LTPATRGLVPWLAAFGIGLLAFFAIVAPLYWRMTPVMMAMVMLSNGIQERHVFPVADMPPSVSAAAEAGETWDQYLAWRSTAARSLTSP
jgi:hypothetical protein